MKKDMVLLGRVVKGQLFALRLSGRIFGLVLGSGVRQQSFDCFGVLFPAEAWCHRRENSWHGIPCQPKCMSRKPSELLSRDGHRMLYGGLSKLWSPLGSPKYQVQYYDTEPKKGHNFDNDP